MTEKLDATFKGL